MSDYPIDVYLITPKEEIPTVVIKHPVLLQLSYFAEGPGSIGGHCPPISWMALNRIKTYYGVHSAISIRRVNLIYLTACRSTRTAECRQVGGWHPLGTRERERDDRDYRKRCRTTRTRIMVVAAAVLSECAFKAGYGPVSISEVAKMMYYSPSLRRWEVSRETGD